MYMNELSPKDAETLMNKKSGVLSVYEKSSDLRDAIKNIEGSPKAKMALDMYVNRIKKYIGNYILLLKKADMLLFTDSLGVDVPVIRNSVCTGLSFFGIEINMDRSNNYTSGLADISGPQAEARTLIVPTNDELMIARESYQSMLCFEAS